jgi:hypothetical protein
MDLPLTMFVLTFVAALQTFTEKQRLAGARICAVRNPCLPPPRFRPKVAPSFATGDTVAPFPARKWSPAKYRSGTGSREGFCHYNPEA